LSISAEISPVNAPDFSKCMFSAPIAILEPLAALTAAWISVNGTHSTISHHLVLDRSGFISSMRALASLGVLFIFQLPAMIVLRYLRFIVLIPLSPSTQTAGAGQWAQMDSQFIFL